MTIVPSKQTAKERERERKSRINMKLQQKL